jgi:hypothetical protein
MGDIIVTKKQLALITERQQLNESLLSFENILMAIGFVPVIGEIADIALICYYLYKGEKLYAAIMLIGLIPGVGQWIAAPIVRLFKGSREGVIAMKEGGQALTKYLAKHPEAATKFASLSKYVKAPAVEKTVQGINKVCPKDKEHNLATNKCIKKCKSGQTRNAKFRCVKNRTKKVLKMYTSGFN